MKTPFGPVVLVLWFLAGLTLTTVAHAADAASSIQDHLAMAAAYDVRIKDLDAVVAEHQQMKKDYTKRFYVNDKITPPAKFEAMNKHCDAIIRDATALRTELAAMANWHKLRAAELEGK